MKAFTTGIGLTAAIAAAFVPPLAAADEPVVPPENSAATQYTEAFPTAGGNRESGGDGSKHPSAAQVLGTDRAHRLEAQGKAGREVAEVVATTAPNPSAHAQEAVGGEPAPGSGAGSESHGAAPPGSQPGDEAGAPAGTPADASAASGEAPDGSSGLGEVLDQATGASSSGQLGVLLPIAIVAAIAWALAYLWRQRRRAA
jgi:hypothetical protein